MCKPKTLGLLSSLVLFAFVAAAGAQGTIQRFTSIFINGNRITASTGTAVVTIPATTQTLIGTTTICTTANWCQATVALTDAQIKALPTTPITLIAAPASGYRIKVLAASIRINSTAAAYTNLNATYASLQLEWGSSGKWAASPIFRDSTTMPAITALSSLLTLGADVVSEFMVPYFGVETYWPDADGFLSSDVSAVALKLTFDNNGSGNLTGGNASNAGKVTIYYAIEATS